MGPNDHGRDVAGDVDRTTDSLDQAELRTLEEALHQLPPAPDMEDSECQRLVQQVQQIGQQPPPQPESESNPAASPSAGDLDVQQLGHYQLLAKLGQGGMGAVYKALHTRLNRLVALKVLPADRLQDAAAIARFDREMRAVGALAHENIVAAHDAGEIDGTHYLVMELVDGADLGTIAREQAPLPVAEACEIIRQAALGLQHAYENNLVHRDIKPSNLMLAAGPNGPVVKILDMGLALLDEQHTEQPDLTASGQIMGTLDYMAPEQAGDTHTVDIRADIYSLGATLYKLLTGRVPFQGPQYTSTVKKLMALATQDPPRIDSLREDLPVELVEVVHRMLARQPEDRYDTPSELAEAIAPWANGANLATLLDTAATRQGDGEQTAQLKTLAKGAASVSVRSSVVETQSQVVPGRRRQTGSQPAAAPGNLPPRRPKRGVLLACAAVPILLGVILLSLRTPHGEIVVELADGISAEAAKNLKIEVTGHGQVKVADAAAGWTIDVAEGKYQAKLSGGTDQFQLEQNQITVTRGEKALLKVSLKPLDEMPARELHTGNSPPPPPSSTVKTWQPTPQQQAFFDHVATLPPEQQVAAVAKKLMEVNPGFSGKFKHQVKNGRVVTFDFNVSAVTDIWPVRALTSLKTLICIDIAPDGKTISKFADLRPLQGMQLETLRLIRTAVSDLSALKEMPLQVFECHRSPIEDLSPLTGMPLRELSLYHCQNVSSLAPLAGAPLRRLGCVAAAVSDLSPLNGMPLETLDLTNAPVEDLSPLAGAPLKKLDCSGTKVSDLSPLAGAPLKDFRCNETRVSDLSPLAGAPLELLHCHYTDVVDLTPVKEMKLTELSLLGTWISDLSPLAGMPLRRFYYDVRLFDDTYFNLVYSLPLTHLNGSPYTTSTPVLEALATYKERRRAALEFAETTSKLQPSQQVDAVVAQLEALNGLEAVSLRIRPYQDNITNVALTLKDLRPKRIDITPLLAFEHLKTLHIIDSPPYQDISCVTLLALEEIICDDRVLFRNLAALKKMPSLKRVNGQPADKYLDYVAREGLHGFANPKSPAISWDATPEQLAFFDHVAKLPADEQAAAVAKKLIEVNPRFDGKIEHRIKDGHVVAFTCRSEHLVEIWPIRALGKLRELNCGGTYKTWAKVSDLSPLRGSELTVLHCTYTNIADLSPLQGMPIQKLSCTRTMIADLTPLKGMPLTFLDIAKTQVKDLAPLAGMQLTELNFNETQVADLSPLKGIPLKRLWCGWTRVTDLSPIQGMALTFLTCGGTRVDDLSPLAGMPLVSFECRDSYVCDLSPLKGMRLKWLHIYGTPIADLSPIADMPLVLLQYDVRLFDEDDQNLIASLPLTYLNGPVATSTPVVQTLVELATQREAALAFAQATSKLPPSERIEAVAAKLEELNGPGPVNLGGHPQRDANADAWVMLKGSKRVDITPLMALTQLKKLDIIGGRSYQDISCLKFLELEELNCDDWILFKNVAVLKKMRTLQRVNGYPATEYLDYVASEGLKGFANPKLPAIPWDVTPEQQAFFDHVATLPAEQQAEAVAKKLMEINPGYDGKYESAVRNGQVVEFHFHTDRITNPTTDVWPIRALPALQQLFCRGSGLIQDGGTYRGNAIDLSQLRGMRIKSLSIKDASIMDLSPLVGMRLNHLACYRTKVADLSPLRGMPLEHFLPDVRLFDETDEAVLRSLPVQRINIDIHGQSTPIAEFWQELAQRRDAAKAFVVEASQLSPVERVTAVRGKLNELNGAGQVRIVQKEEDGHLDQCEVYLAGKAADLTPLMAFTDLKKLALHDGVPWQDLSCLKFLPLEELTCSEDAAYKSNGTLRAIKTLRTINGMPAEQFWQKLLEE